MNVAQKSSKLLNKYYEQTLKYVNSFISLEKSEIPNEKSETPKVKSKKDRQTTSSKKPKKEPNTDRLMTKQELKEYDGSEDSKGIYVAILGSVFDVGTGRQHYGPGGGYSFFA
ncbi:UNVERIFIED_CONTAM: hypothetical protein B566_EDAN019346, partial [Ephemera danica]